MIAADVEKLLNGDDLARIRQQIDFIGVNYYSPMYQKRDPAGLVGSDWGAVPAGTQRTAHGLADRAGRTARGTGSTCATITAIRRSMSPKTAPVSPMPPGRAAASTTANRIAFLRDHLAACHRALAQKVNLQGYFAWTLLDNFEWAEGYTAPFGLVQVDRATLKRTPKASFDWFARVVQGNSLP